MGAIPSGRNPRPPTMAPVRAETGERIMARQKKSNGHKAAKRTSKREKMERLQKHDCGLRARMVKKLEQEKEPQAKEAKRTIKAAVIEIFAANAAATNAELVAAVKAEFPQSAFDAMHASWYRMQAKSGKLTGTKVVIPPRQKAATTASSTTAN